MNGSLTTSGVTAVSRRSQRLACRIVPRRRLAVLSAKDLKQHTLLLAQGRPMSGKSGPFVYYMRNGRQCWRRDFVPFNPRTPAQTVSRTAFRAAAIAWSHNQLLTEAQRNAWYAKGAKVHSRRRLSSSGPLTGQQHFIGCNCLKRQRGLGLLLDPMIRQAALSKGKSQIRQFAQQVQRYQLLAQSTPGTRRSFTLYSPCLRLVARGYRRKIGGLLLPPQGQRYQRLTQSTPGRPHTTTGVLPDRYRCRQARNIHRATSAPRPGRSRNAAAALRDRQR